MSVLLVVLLFCLKLVLVIYLTKLTYNIMLNFFDFHLKINKYYKQLYLKDKKPLKEV